jgi:tetratricopeptide (TPR) repeat protein
LLSTADGSQVWGGRYSRTLSGIFAVEEQIAKEIAEKLRLRLTGEERRGLSKRYTEDIRAYQNYLQGRSHAQRRTHQDLFAAISYYEKAIEEDSNYALAYAGLTDAYAVLVAEGRIAPDEGRRKAGEAASKALSLDEHLAEAHASIGQINIFFAPFDFSTGDHELRRAIELSPSLAIAHQFLGASLLEQGRLDEGVEEWLKARELDPLSPIIGRMTAYSYLLKRDYRRALELHRQTNELGPTFVIYPEVEIYIQSGALTQALAELEKAKREGRDDPTLIYNMGMVYAALGRREEALQIIKELERMSGPSLSLAHMIARIYAALNENELALAWLKRGFEAGAIPIFYKNAPNWDTIRRDSRFQDLLRRMGIPQ